MEIYVTPPPNTPILPFISCKCITYGRVDFLEESIESFLRQKYKGKKELIIVNDYPKQKLIYDHPEIKIYNTDKTFQTIGHKENFALSKCSGNLIAVWDDDDLALPNHLENISKYMGNNDLLHWGRGVFMNNSTISSIIGLGNSGIVYTKKIWKLVGKHPHENAGYDMSFVLSIKNLPNVKTITATPNDNEVSWIYVWDGRGYHMSGQGNDTNDKPNIIERHKKYIEEQVKLGLIKNGNIYLKPNWKHNYVKMLEKYNLKKVVS